MTAYQTVPAEQLLARPKPIVWPVQFAAIAAVATYLHAMCWAVIPPDMIQFLIPWYDHILERGPLVAFSEPFSNYTPPYLYLLAAASALHPFLEPMQVIKWLSVAGTAFLAISIADLLKAVGAEPRRAAFVFLLPTVVLNAALLGQCDALWAGACVFGVAAMIRGRTAASLVWCGLAIALKAQSAFIAPFIIGALIGRRAPLWHWAIPGLVYAGLMLPAWAMGWPAADLATVYLRQADWFAFPGNLSNPWIWATQFAPRAAKTFYVLGYAAAAAAAIGIGLAAARTVRRPRALLALALLSALAEPYLLPKMHERYLFLADALALALAFTCRDRESIGIAIAVQLTSFAAIFSYVTNWRVPALIGAFVGAMAIVAIWNKAKSCGARWSSRRAVAATALA